MSELVEFTNVHGEKKLIPLEAVKERDSVYALVLHGRNVLFVNVKETGKKWVLGGGVEPGEAVEDALRREAKEEADVELEDIRALYEDETYFFHEPTQTAWHVRLLFFTARSQSDRVVDKELLVPNEDTHQPHWVNVDDVRVEDLQPVLDRIYPLVRDEIVRRMSDGGISVS